MRLCNGDKQPRRPEDSVCPSGRTGGYETPALLATVVLTAAMAGLGACGIRVVNPAGPGATGDGGSSSGGPPAPTGAGGTPADPSTTTDGPSGSGGTGCAFNVCGDAGPGPTPCDAWMQDCPGGQKCNPITTDGTRWHDAVCVPVDPLPNQPGDPCSTGQFGAGSDDCSAGSVCWNVDSLSGLGTCVELCRGTAAEPECSSGEFCVRYGDSVYGQCASACGALVQDCPESQVCGPVTLDDLGFACMLDLSGKWGGPWSPCEELSACNPGHYCAAVDRVPGCPAIKAGCCTPFCDIENPECPPELEWVGAVCVQWPDQSPGAGADPTGSCTYPEP